MKGGVPNVMGGVLNVVGGVSKGLQEVTTYYCDGRGSQSHGWGSLFDGRCFQGNDGRGSQGDWKGSLSDWRGSQGDARGSQGDGRGSKI